MASRGDTGMGVNKSDLKKGTLTKLFSDLENPGSSNMTPAEAEAAKKRKKLEDEADARRKAAADQNPANRTPLPKLSDLFK